MPLSLAECQKAFAAYLRARPDDADPQALEALVTASGREAAGRLDVYRNNVYSRLATALTDTYPVVARLVGDAFFRFAAIEYIATHFPATPALLDFGGHFPAFLEEFEPAGSVPYLADVARLESLWLDAYHAEEADCISVQAYRDHAAGASAEQSVLLHPSARLLRSPYPVSRIWEFNTRESAANGRLRLPDEPEHLLIIRPQATVEIRRLTPAAFLALKAIHAGAPHYAALESARSVAADAAKQLEQLAAAGTFIEDTGA